MIHTRILVFGLCLLASAPAYAVCTRPDGVEGEIIYNKVHQLPQYCDGSSWIGIGWKGGGAGAQPAGSTGQIQFNSGDNTLAASPQLYWDDTNSTLTIGSATPQGILTVVEGEGSVGMRGISSIKYTTTTSGPQLNMAKAQGTEAAPLPLISGTVLGAIWFRGHNGTDFMTTAGIRALSEDAFTATSTPTYLHFSTTPPNASTYAERMRITGEGNVGINTTTPRATLDVNGSIITGPMGANGSTSNTSPGFHASTNGYLWLARDGNNAGPLYIQRIGSSSNGLINFYANSTAVGTITTNGTTTSYNTSSDYRLKDGIASITGALPRLKALKPSQYHFKATPEKTEEGFIAHEVAAIAPYAVTGTRDALNDDGTPAYQQVDYGKLTPLLAAALKELAAEVETLRITVDAQAREIQALKAAK